MYTLESLIYEIKKIDNLSEIEFELKLLPDKQYRNGKLISTNYSHDEIKQLFESLFHFLNKKYSFIERHYVNLISDNGFNKQFEYENYEKNQNSKLLYVKTKLKDQYLCLDGISWKLKVCREKKMQNESVATYKLIRFKRRFSSELNSKWRIDYTFVMQIDSNSSEQIIKNAKNSIFKTPIQNIFNVANSIEIEIEYIGELCMLDTNETFKILKMFNDYVDKVKRRPNAELYNDAIKHLQNISEINYSNTRRLSIKQLLPQVRDMSKKEYFNIINECPNKYYVTEKTDGERVVLFIIKNFIGYLTTSKWTDLHTCSEITFSAIFDCELFDNVFYIFDVLWYNYDNKYPMQIFMCPFMLRLQLLQNIFDKIKSIVFSPDIRITLKNFTKLNANYSMIINEQLKKITDVTDGLIFTYAYDPYMATTYFKWKPIEKLSIDFIAKLCPKELLGVLPYEKKRGKYLYLLFVGIRHDMCRAFNLKKFTHHHKLFSLAKRTDYFPIPFSPSSNPTAYLFWYENASLDNKVIELIYANAQWQLLRIRDDKHTDYLNEQCFGNDYRTAELIWNKYHNIFTTNYLLADPSTMKEELYFVKDNSADYIGLRKFDNYVKENILFSVISDNIKSSCLIDLGAGKGQDFLKYIRFKIQNILFVDSNANNIDEIVARKYLYFEQQHFKHTSVKVNVLCCSVMDNDFVAKIKKITPGSKLIVCNFAIHYMVKNKSTAQQYAQVISDILEPGGRLIITYLNGKKIFNLLSEQKHRNAEWNCGKYSIRRKYISNIYTGSNQKIEIKLPFSNGYYEEYLFNIDILTDAFKAMKINEESRGTFAEFIDAYSRNYINYKLDAHDCQYVQLNEYVVYYRK